MLTDLNSILDGLTELDEKGVETIDCRRAQFSAQEPIIRLRMICQSWKVMFQAEYSSGQPLRMLVDLRASVDSALGHDAAAEDDGKAIKPAPAKAAPRAAAAVASASGSKRGAAAQAAPEAADEPEAKFADAHADAPEFDVSAAPEEWNPDADSQPGKKQ
jgi:hypothetical protein